MLLIKAYLVMGRLCVEVHLAQSGNQPNIKLGTAYWDPSDSPGVDDLANAVHNALRLAEDELGHGLSAMGA